MGDSINWLVTVLYSSGLLRCALKVKRDTLPEGCAQYPMEPENLETIHALLPLHVRSCGPIVGRTRAKGERSPKDQRFCGYPWMVDSIVDHNEIKTETP